VLSRAVVAIVIALAGVAAAARLAARRRRPTSAHPLSSPVRVVADELSASVDPIASRSEAEREPAPMAPPTPARTKSRPASGSLRRERARAVIAMVGVCLILVGAPLPAVVADSAGRGKKETAVATQKAQGNPDKAAGNARKTQTPAPTPTPTTVTPTPTPMPAPTAAPTAAAPTSGYSVATWGNDANAGTLTAPWRTLQKAADSVPAGGTVYIRAGTYPGFKMTRSGTSIAEITFTEYPGEVATISGTGGPAKVVSLTAVHDITISNLTIQDAPSQYGAGIYIENGSYDIAVSKNLLRNNRSFGVKVLGSTAVAIRNNTITKNETGIEISGAGAGVTILDNRIDTNDRLIVNDATAWNDRGANGISFYRTTGSITVSRNQVYGNRGVSYDYGFDGGAFEIYASSNLTITDNTLWDNENVVETGTDGTNCTNNTFARNVAYHGSTTSVAGPTMGLILRCASNMTVANNAFYGLDRFTFDVSLAGGFAASIDGLRIHNNIAVATEHPYSLDTAIPATVAINNNLIYNPSGGAIAYVYGRGNTNFLSEFSSWTGFDTRGIQADPNYLSPSTADFHIGTTSAAIDKGLSLTGITAGYLGLAPDMGRYETK
jgi:parallel beta-helix repeat protein